METYFLQVNSNYFYNGFNFYKFPNACFNYKEKTITI